MTKLGNQRGAASGGSKQWGDALADKAVLTRQLLSPSMGALICTLLVALAATVMMNGHWRTDNIQRTTATFRNVLDLSITHDVEFITAILDEIVTRRPDIRTSFVARQRDTLLDDTKAHFAQLRQRYQITHFYFHDPLRRNFLRVHDPGRHGDVIERFTALQAEKTGETVAGIELGVLGTLTLRVVAPWWSEGELLGYLEIGKEIDDIIGDLHRSLGIGLALYVDKEHLNRKDWELGRKLLDRPGRWDPLPDHVLLASHGQEIPPQRLASLDLDRHSESWEIPVKEQSVGDSNLVATTQPFRDASGKRLGHFLISQDLSRARQVHQAELLLIAGAYAGGFLFLALLLRRRTGHIAADIAETQAALQAANTDLRELDQRKTDFLSTVSHELRTPLTCIQSAASIIQRYHETKPEVAGRFGRTISSEARRLGRLIDDLLDLTRIESGRAEWNADAIDVKAIVNRVVEFFAPAALREGITVESRVPETLPPAWCDGDRLTQVLTNLMNNATKFTPRGGNIIVKVAEEETSLLFTVRDTGIGIPDAELERVFDRFHQVASTTYNTGKPSGTGLGLAICRDIVEWHGGRIRAERAGPRGLTVAFTVPIADEPEFISQSPNGGSADGVLNELR